MKGCQDDTRKKQLGERINALKAVFTSGLSEETPFECPGIVKLNSEDYEENHWTKRLYYSLKEVLPLNMKVRDTAQMGHCFQYFQEQFSNAKCTGCYLFQGGSRFDYKEGKVIYGYHE